MVEDNQMQALPQSENNILMMMNAALAVPGVKVNREAFLVEKFHMTTDQIKHGRPQDFFSEADINKVARESINRNVLSSAGASTLTGIPGGIAMAATIPADIMQNMGFSIRLSQELGYIYGYDNILDPKGKLTEEGQQQLILFLGVMFSAQGAGSIVRVMSKNASVYLAKKIMNTALTKTWWYPLLKSISKVVASKTLTKQGLTRITTKALPIVGGVLSGGLTFATMRPAADRLRSELAKNLNYTQDAFDADFEVVSSMIEKFDEAAETALD